MKAFQFGGHFSSYKSMADRSIRLTFDTQEATPELMSNIQNSFQKTCVLAISADNFTSDYLKEMENIKVEFPNTEKSPAKRLKSVMFRLWEQNNEGVAVFNDFYEMKMERLINNMKDQLL